MLDIAFVTDYVCPYCFVAREALEQAVIELQMQREVKITAYPCELTPPEQEQVDTWNDPERRARYQTLETSVEELNLHMKLPPRVTPRPRTRLAFEAWLYACDHDRGNLWSSCMYHAYFVDEIDIGDKNELLHIAKSLLMDADDLSKALDEHRYTEKLLALEAQAREKFQPRHVPTIYLNGKYMKLKEYTRDEIMAHLMLARHRTQEAETADPAGAVPETGASCGIDGCR